jgi:Heme/copper-type cytochrome/quinol oxidases, subunit 2
MQKTSKNSLRLVLWMASVVTFSFLINPYANADAKNPYGGAEVKKEEPATMAEAVPVTAETGADGIQRLAITLDSYSFSPAHIIVQSGKPVEFTLKNVSSIAPHSFKIDAAADGLNLDQDIGPGKTATLFFIPAKTGMYEFYCDKKLAFFPSHRKKGMVGKLEVR